jgi:hypothetical protein
MFDFQKGLIFQRSSTVKKALKEYRSPASFPTGRVRN